MKINKKVWMLVLSLIFMISLLAGCGNSGDTKDPEQTGGETETTDTDAVEATTGGDAAAETTDGQNVSWDTFVVDPEAYKGKTLIIWKWWDMAPEDIAAKTAFEEMTGATIEWVNVPWAEYGTKLVASVSSGTGPDICLFGPEAIPTYINKNIILPLSDYVNLQSPAFTTYRPQAEKIVDYYTVNEKVYALMDSGPKSHKLYYRKDLLENAGLEDPYDLYMNGEWTWDKWFELMEGVTQDTNGDGVFDVWGFDAWMTITQFVYTNGADFVTDGVFSVTDPKFIEALDYYRKLRQPDYIWKPWEDGKDPQGNLIAGAVCFDYWGYWDMPLLRESIGDNLGFVPFPKGPSATNDSADYYDSTVSDGIAASSQNPELAGLWLEFLRLPETVELWNLKQEEVRQADILNYGSDVLVDLAYKMGAQAVVDSSVSYPGLGDIVQAIVDDTTKSATQLANESLAAGQAIVDAIVNGQ